MTLQNIISTLKTVYNKYPNIKLGIAGSYARGEQHKNSNIDVVIIGDSTRMDIMEYIKGLFKTDVDVLWLDLLEQEDKELDSFALQNGMNINPYSVYKNVLRDVI